MAAVIDGPVLQRVFSSAEASSKRARLVWHKSRYHPAWPGWAREAFPRREGLQGLRTLDAERRLRCSRNFNGLFRIFLFFFRS